MRRGGFEFNVLACLAALIVAPGIAPGIALATVGSLEADRTFKQEIARCEAGVGTGEEQCACAATAFQLYKTAISEMPFSETDDHYVFHSAEERTAHYLTAWSRYAGHLGCGGPDAGTN